MGFFHVVSFHSRRFWWDYTSLVLLLVIEEGVIIAPVFGGKWPLDAGGGRGVFAVAVCVYV